MTEAETWDAFLSKDSEHGLHQESMGKASRWGRAPSNECHARGVSPEGKWHEWWPLSGLVTSECTWMLSTGTESWVSKEPPCLWWPGGKTSERQWEQHLLFLVMVRARVDRRWRRVVAFDGNGRHLERWARYLTRLKEVLLNQWWLGAPGTFGNICFGYYNWAGGVIDISWEGARDTLKHPTVFRAHNKESTRPEC